MSKSSAKSNLVRLQIVSLALIVMGMATISVSLSAKKDVTTDLALFMLSGNIFYGSIAFIAGFVGWVLSVYWKAKKPH